MRKCFSILLLSTGLFTSLLAGCSGSGSGSSTAPQSNPPPATPPPSLEARITQVIETAVASGLPSVSFHLLEGSKQISVARGVQDRATGESVTVASRYHIASNGKLVTAVTIMQLVEQGILALDDALLDWLPEALQVPQFEGISLRMLLSHTSGIPDYLQQPDFLDDLVANPSKRWAAEEALGYLQTAALLSVPGTKFEYSNTNYLLLGVIVEQATGLSFGGAIRMWVLDGLALPNTFHTDEAFGHAPLIRGYFEQSEQSIFPGGDEIDATAWTEAHWFGDAPLQSTPADWVTLVRALFTTDELLSADSVTELTTPTLGDSTYGLGIYIGETPAGEIAYFHGGAIWGYSSEFFHVPERDLTIAVFANGQGGAHTDRFAVMIGDLLELLQLNGGS